MAILQLLIGTNIPFMKFRTVTYMFSGALILATAVWLIVHGGPKYSVDFTGGTLIQLRLSRTLSADGVRKAIDASGLRGVELQQMTGENRNEFLIRLQAEWIDRKRRCAARGENGAGRECWGPCPGPT